MATPPQAQGNAGPSPASRPESLDVRCINTLRGLAVDAIEAAGSGHPGLPLGAAPMAYVLFDRHLKMAPKEPNWPDRDRFVLSAGHGSMLLYGLLHLCGYDVSLDDLKAFRQLGSKTPGHPEVRVTPGVEASTGPLGQGAANSVGLAVAETVLAARFNRPGHVLFDHRTWALVSDGDLMEGVAQEAASLAGHWRLKKLTWLYDANQVTLDGPAKRSASDDVAARFVAMGWQVIQVADGNQDLAALEQALGRCKSADRPTLVVVHTTIGYGAPNKQGSHKSHGAPLGAEEARACKAFLRLPAAPFAVAEDVRAHMGRHATAGRRAAALWQAKRTAWAAAHPQLAAELKQALAGGLPNDLEAYLDRIHWPEDVSTRAASGRMVQAVAERLPELLGGDADLSVSTLSSIVSSQDYGPAATAPANRNLRYGVREHAMAAIANGLAYHGGVVPFVATFFAFSDYLRPALRMAALAELGVLWLLTHDSVALGEDGPTHQPIEHLAGLRAMPHLLVLRPADAHETQAAWSVALRHACPPHPAGQGAVSAVRARPAALVLSRQTLPRLPAALATAENVARGAYVIWQAAGLTLALPGQAALPVADALLLASGSEVHLALAAAKRLQAEGILCRVISMPCWELFAAQPQDYQDSILPPTVHARVSVEAAATLGWARWTGSYGSNVGIDQFGLSAPGPKVLAALGLTEERVMGAVRDVVARLTGRAHASWTAAQQAPAAQH